MVLLTNRVYPNDNTSVSSTRQAVANAAVRAFDNLPGQPRLHSIVHNEDGGWTVKWDYSNNIDSVMLIEEFNGGTSGRNTMILSPDSLTFTLGAIDCICQRSVKLVPFYAGVTGDTSDTYYMKESTSNKYALIVDGYDRVSNDMGWSLPYHAISGYYANALPETWGYTSCDNQAIIDGDVILADYDCVLWFCGDESTSDESFSSIEQVKVKTFLEQGGRLFVSGSEIGYDLSYKGSANDKSFYENYFKTRYLGDDSNDLSVYGRSNTRFEGLSFNYGGPSALYQEDYPDLIISNAGSKVILYYYSSAYAGVAYVGPFGTSSDTGKVISLGFPFETIQGENNRIALMSKIIDFFESALEVSVEDIFGHIPNEFELHPAYPNPFNPTTTIDFTLPHAGDVQLGIYNLSGKCVDRLIDKRYETGKYSYKWNASNYPSGVYFCKLNFAGLNQVQKLVLIK
ncbi:MAG: hypothetical protein DRP93_08720 [Candidatus Neomarinimicrobiota bacterium]|nr:MAG: hypothetical protein DRP93_08720 [Candidatus Neomarinimicrobiota bacterium]